ncbi:MAG: outer membrane beta-barrel protein [Thermoplasmata archaeon]
MRRSLGPIVVLSLFPCAVFAQGLGVRAGLMRPEHFDMAFTFGAFGTYRATPHLEMEGAIDYWSRTETESYGRTYEKRKASNLSLSGYTKHMLPLYGGALSLGVGGGFGIHFYHIEYRFEDQTLILHESYDETKYGIHVFWEASTRLSQKLSLSTRFKIGIVEDDTRFDLTIGLLVRDIYRPALIQRRNLDAN